MANPAVVVDFVANTKDLQKGFDDATKKSGGFSSKLKGLAAGGALAGFAALTSSLKVGIEEFAEAQKVSAQTDAVLKSTGKQAGVTAEGVAKLSESLMKKSGVDDEAIQSGQNLLLTFTNIKNEAGKGNDVFDQTTKAALDMSVALGTDMKSASMTLGKALNDPLKGMAKLTKQGVTFTDAQKKQAAAMVEAGDAAGAQKIILAEVNKEFGGSAEAAGKTLPGQLEILKQQFSNLMGTIVAKVIPVLMQVVKILNEHRTTVVAVIGVLAALTAGFLAYKAALAAYQVIQAAIQVATKAWTAAQWLLNVALNANPIGLVVLAIGALVAAFVLAYKHSDTFRELVDKAFAAVLKIVKTVWNWLKTNWPLLLGILTGPIGLAVVAIVKNWDTIRDTVTSAVATVKNAVTGAWNTIKTTTTNVWNAVEGAVTDVITAVRGALAGLRDWITAFAEGTFTAAVNKIKAVFNAIKNGAEDAVHEVKVALNGVVTWLGEFIERAATKATSIGNAIKTGITGALSGVGGALKTAIGDALNAVIDLVNRFKIPPIKIKGKTIFKGWNGANIPHVALAAGGIVTSPTLALLGEAGPEAVIPLNGRGGAPVEVRVYIGDTELKGLVRTEIVDSDTGIARTLLAGAAG